MRALILQHPRTLPAWVKAAGWLAVFLSPTGFFLLLMIADRLQMPAPAEILVVSLFCLIPIVALLVCGAAVWRSKARWRTGGLVLTVLAMCCQVGILLIIIVTALTAIISPAQ